MEITDPVPYEFNSLSRDYIRMSHNTRAILNALEIHPLSMWSEETKVLLSNQPTGVKALLRDSFREDNSEHILETYVLQGAIDDDSLTLIKSEDEDDVTLQDDKHIVFITNSEEGVKHLIHDIPFDIVHANISLLEAL